MEKEDYKITTDDCKSSGGEGINEVCETRHVHKKKVGAVKNAMPDEDVIYDLAELFKVFGDSTRTKIISALFESELCVCDICAVLSMTKSAVSHQLRILRQTNIVKARRSGKEVFYSLDDEHIYQIYQTALKHLIEED